MREAEAQLRWFLDLRSLAPALVHGSHNLVEVNRGSPFAMAPERFSISLGPVAPWAFSHVWNAPAWRAEFSTELQQATADAAAPEKLT